MEEEDVWQLRKKQGVKSFRIKMLNINILDVECYLKTQRWTRTQSKYTGSQQFSDLRLADKLAPFLFSRIHSTYSHTVGTQSQYFSISLHFEVSLSVFPEGSNYKTFLLSTSDVCLMMVRTELCQSAQWYHEQVHFSECSSSYSKLWWFTMPLPQRPLKKLWETVVALNVSLGHKQS